MGIYITADKIQGSTDPDAIHIQRLIGKQLRDVRISGSGMVLSFDPFGEITVKVFLDVNASTNAALFKDG